MDLLVRCFLETRDDQTERKGDKRHLRITTGARNIQLLMQFVLLLRLPALCPLFYT